MLSEITLENWIVAYNGCILTSLPIHCSHKLVDCNSIYNDQYTPYQKLQLEWVVAIWDFPWKGEKNTVVVNFGCQSATTWPLAFLVKEIK